MKEENNPTDETVSGLVIDVAQADVITDLAPADRALLALKSSQTEVTLRELATKHTSIQVIKDKAGREQAHGAAMELMRARTSIKKAADEARDDAKKFNAAVIAEEKRLTGIVEPEENRLKGLRDAWDDEQARIKREAEEKERARVLALGARIQEIRGLARLAQDCRSSDAVRRLIDRLGAIDMTGFEEFEAEAINVLTDTRQQVEQVLNARLATEAEAARLKAEREELARQQAETAERQRVEAEKLAAERAELERMRAELEAAKAPKVDPAEPLAADINPLPVIDADLVDTAPAIEQPADEVIALTEKTFVIQMTQRDGVDLSIDAPPAASLINCVAEAYGVDAETACQWLCARADDFEAWIPSVAEIA